MYDEMTVLDLIATAFEKVNAGDEHGPLITELAFRLSRSQVYLEKLTAVTEQRDRLLEQQEQWRLSSVCRELVEQLTAAREELKAVTEQRDKLAELSGFGEFDKPIFP